jgi:hypothetical protein
MSSSARETFSKLTSPMWPAIVVGMAVGAIVGVLGYPVDGGRQATALIRIYQPVDPDQILTTTALSSDMQQSYISGEVTYLSSPSFHNAVAKQLGDITAPDVTAAQDGQSSIITLSASQPSGGAAQRVVDAAVNVYSEHARDQSRQRGQEAINAINDVIGALHEQNRSDGGQDETTSSSQEYTSESSSASKPGNDVAARIQQLELQRSSIEVQSRRSAPVQVVQPPTLDVEKGAPRWMLGASAGALLGGLLTLGVIVAGRRRAGVITTPADVAAEVDQWLRPVVGLSGVTGPHSSYLPFARNLYAQLPSPRSGRILVVGASAESGSASITRLVAAGLREHSPVTVVDLSDAFSGAFDLRSRNDLDRVTVVLDGGSIATTPSLPDAAKEASQIIVVARIGRDVHDNVRVIAQLARRNGIPVTAVCTRRGFRLTKSRTGLHRETRNQHETSEVDVSSAG